MSKRIREYLELGGKFVRLLWVVDGPRNTQIEKLSCWHVERGDEVHIILAEDMGEDGFYLFAEVPGDKKGTALKVEYLNNEVNKNQLIFDI